MDAADLEALGAVVEDTEADTAIDEMVPTREEDLMDLEVHHHMENIQKVSTERQEKVLHTDMAVEAAAAVDMEEEDTSIDEEDGEVMDQEEHHHLLHSVVLAAQVGLT